MPLGDDNITELPLLAIYVKRRSLSGLLAANEISFAAR